MRNFTSDSEDKAPPPVHPDGTDWTLRTVADFKSLLLELARAERGFLFYAETHERRRTLADRVHRAFTIEIRRAGPIRFQIERGGFRLQGSETMVPSVGALLGLEETCRTHAIEALHFGAELTATALVGFLDQLGHAANRYVDAEDFARALAARDSTGLEINGHSDIAPTMRLRLSATPPRAALSAASVPPAVEAPVLTEATGSEGQPDRSFEEAPLEVRASDDRGERLRARLIELDATTDDTAYGRRVADVVVWAEDLWNEEAHDDYYRALLVVADHAVGGGGRSEAQARAAAASFASLASARRLGDLIGRAATPRDGEASNASVRAAQLLLQLGDVAIPAIFDRLCAESDPAREASLRALILTQGEAAIPHLVTAIEGQDVGRAREGIRLAGELQNAAMLPVLLEALAVPDLSRRIETIRALSLLPGDESKQALTEALTSDLEEIASAASEALEKATGGESLPTFLDVLEASLQTSRTKLGTTLIGVLGRLGDERAVPRLCSILERRPVLRRAHWHAIQLATVEALSVLPTKEARRSLERAALHAPLPIRDRARVLLAEQDEPPKGLIPADP